MNVAELVNLIGFKLDRASYNAVNDATTKIMNNMESMANKATTLFTLPIVALYGASVKMYSQEREAIAQVEQTLSTTHNRAKQSLSDLLNEAGRLQRETILEDDQVIREVTNRLLTFQNIAGQQFTDAQQIIVDMSAKLDPTMRNLSEIALQVGKALDDPTLGLTMLNRVGIRFSETQKKLIEDTWKLGKRSEAQAMIIKELNKTYAGSAKVVAQNSTGTKQFMNAIGDMMEMFGKDIFPTFKRFMSWITDLAYKLQDLLTPALRKTILIFAGFLALIGPITLGLIGIGKAGLFVNTIMSQLGLGIAKSNLGIMGTLGKYGLLLGQFLLIAGALFLIFDDIYNYVTGGKSLIGELLPPWKELGPKIMAALKPYIILLMDLWESVKNTVIEYVNFIYDVFQGNTDAAGEHFKNFIKGIFDIATTLLAMILPLLWEALKVLTKMLFIELPKALWELSKILGDATLSILKGLWSLIWEWLISSVDKLANYIVDRMYALADTIKGILPDWIKNLPGQIGRGLQAGVTKATQIGDWLNAPQYATSPQHDWFNQYGSNKTTKEINVTVNAGLNVPHGTNENQKNYLTKTVQDLFNDHINNLSRNLVQGLPGVD